MNIKRKKIVSESNLLIYEEAIYQIMYETDEQRF